jgi:hypothetical protein
MTFGREGAGLEGVPPLVKAREIITDFQALIGGKVARGYLWSSRRNSRFASCSGVA